MIIYPIFRVRFFGSVEVVISFLIVFQETGRIASAFSGDVAEERSKEADLNVSAANIMLCRAYVAVCVNREGSF